VNVTLKNVPREVHRRLKKQAEANHRSINGEAIVILDKGTLQNPPDVRAIITELEKLNRLQKGPITFKESRAGIEEGRE
jgi:plasmid stability protein